MQCPKENNNIYFLLPISDFSVCIHIANFRVFGVIT